ncbi:TetR/AcrR family transcriptional regulator OS=Streptomyces alboniger OX=132473 GN=CP975_32950 PE=4 SV=1 [Streptomyces alboniger]
MEDVAGPDRRSRRSRSPSGIRVSRSVTRSRYASRNRRAHAHGYRAFHRADASGDRTVRRVYRRALAAQEREILAALAADPEFGPLSEARPDLALAVRGWLAFTTAVCLEWLRGSKLSHAQVRDLCARALLGVIAP